MTNAFIWHPIPKSPMKLNNSHRLSSILFLAAALPAMSASFTYNNSTTSTTDAWTAGTNWSAMPVSASDTELTFVGANTTVFANVLPISDNDNAGNFALNVLNLQGTGLAASTPLLTLQGGMLDFVANGATAPVINLNAVTANSAQYSSTNTTLAYTVSSAIKLDAATTFAGTGTARFKFAGAFSGTGDILKTGSSYLELAGVNGAYSGNITVNGGRLIAGSANAGATAWVTTGNLTLGASGKLDSGTSGYAAGTIGFAGLYGSGQINYSAGGPRAYAINYNGSTTDSFTGTFGGNQSMLKNGVGTLSLNDFAIQGGGMQVYGGTVTANKMTSAGNNANIYVINGLVKFTPVDGTTVVTGNDRVSLTGGILWIAPSGTGGDITVTGGMGNSSDTAATLGGNGGKLILDRANKASVTYAFGGGSNATGGLSKGTLGSLIVAPAHGLSALGVTEKFTILGSAIIPGGTANPSTAANGLRNGILNPGIFGQNNDATLSGEFLTYSGTGVAGDAGIIQATYSALTDINNCDDTIVYDAGTGTNTNLLNANHAVYAVNARNQTLDLGTKVLALGHGTSSNRMGGLILNGGSITNGTLDLDAGTSRTDLTIYTSAANGTISAKIKRETGADPYYGITTTGPGVLTLSGANTGPTSFIIGSGSTVEVTLGTPGSSQSISGFTGMLNFRGGVIQSQGTFTRSLGELGSSNTLSWTYNNNSTNTGGGFAARGGDLLVKINNGTGTLTWNNSLSYTGLGGTSQFLGDGAPLIFGSPNSDSQVDFQNGINLGGNSYLFSRVIQVNQGTGTDSAKLSGVISSTDPKNQLVKSGPGKLILSAANTYQGDTLVTAGSLLISGSNAATGNLAVSAGASLALTGGLGFTITNTASNSISGAGTATLDGAFTLNTAAVTNATGTWTVVNKVALNATFGASFSVVGFAQKPDGVTWTLTEEGTRLWTFSEATGVLTLAEAPTNTYDSWIDGYFTGVTDPAIIGAAADPDNDGIANAVEYVIGNAPNQTKVENLPAGTLVTDPAGVTPTGNYLKFAYRRTAAAVDAGVTAAVQYDADLVGPWTTAVNGVGGVTIIETANAGLPGTDVKVYIPRVANTKLFSRLAVEVP